MSFPDYPAAHSMDTYWFAIDEAGEVAMFDTNEDGPVPEGPKAVDGFYTLPEFLNRDEFGIPVLAAVNDPMAHGAVLRDVDRIVAKLDAKERLALDRLVFEQSLSEAESAALKHSFIHCQDAFVELQDTADSVVFSGCNGVIRLNETRALFHLLGSEAKAEALCLLAKQGVAAWRWAPSAFLFDGSLLRDIYGIYRFEQEHQDHDFHEYLIAPSFLSPYSRREVPNQPRRGLDAGMATPERPAPVHALPSLMFAVSERVQVADLIRCYGWSGKVQEPASAEAGVRRYLLAYCEADPTARMAQMEGLRQLAMVGDLIAQYVLGCLYGRSDVADFAESARWFEAAARLTEYQRPGDADCFGNGAAAQFCLADAYERGRGALPDQAKAIHWFERAADGGLARASYELGLRYKDGQGVPVDGVTAHRLLRVARAGGSNDARWELMNYPDFQGANAGDAESQYELAEMYASGRAVEKNAATSLQWYIRAAEQGHVGALLEWARLLILRAAPSDAGQLQAVRGRLEATARGGDPQAQYLLGKALSAGSLGLVDLPAAREWLGVCIHQAWHSSRWDAERLLKEIGTG